VPETTTPRPRGRPGGGRERILDVACDLISSEGMDDVRVARIAQAAGVSTALVHYHFATREALLGEALRHAYARAADARTSLRGRPDASVARLLARMIEHCLPLPGRLEREWVLWVELWLRAVRHPEMRPTAGRLYERMRAWFADALREGIERGQLQSGVDPDRLADRILALADGYGVRVLFGDMDVAEARREIWDAVAPALGLPEDPPPPLDPENPQR
jgi:AcrR family transcriptional regulator